jgi:hypothetical protein
MNLALMVKWIWRLFSEDNNNLLWVRLLKAKYRVSEFFLSQPTNCSPFWHSLHKIKQAFKLGASFHPGRASKVSFWKDVWLGETALAQSFPNLFAKCADPDITICQAYSEEEWNIQFRRNFNQDDVRQWQDLLDNLQATQLTEELDKISWRLEPFGKFSTKSKSMYQALCNGPTFPVTKLIWSPNIPLKIKIFTWQMFRGRLPSSDQIHARGGPSDGNCVLCGRPENVDHIFFQCVIAKFLWSGVRVMFSVNWNPRSRQEWLEVLEPLNPKCKRMLWTYFAAQCWALWNTRNKFTIERKFPRQPANCVFQCLINLQLWRPLQKPRDLRLMEELEAMVKNLFSNTYDPSTPPAQVSGT